MGPPFSSLCHIAHRIQVLSDEYLARLVSLPSEALALRASLLHLLNLLVVFAAECRSTPGAADPASCFAASARTFSAVLLRCSAAAEQLASLQAVVHGEDGVDSSRARQQQGPWGEQLARAFVVEGAQFCLEVRHSNLAQETGGLVCSMLLPAGRVLCCCVTRGGG